MPEKNKTTRGQEFLKLLESASQDKDKLLKLASTIIQYSPSKRGLKKRDLPDDETAMKMKASVAKFNAYAGKDVATDGMLAMIADTYHRNNFGSPKKFKEDFKRKYPQDYDDAQPLNNLRERIRQGNRRSL